MARANTKQNHEATLDEIKSERTSDLFTEFLVQADWKAIITKSVIGYVFIATAFVAANNIAVMLALLTSIVWLQYIVYFAVLCALAVGIVTVTPLVADSIYGAGAFIGRKAVAGYGVARDWLSAKRTQFAAPSTVQ